MPVEKIKNFFLSLHKKKITLLVFFFILITPLFILAQELEVEYPEIFGEKPETVQYGLAQYGKYLFNFAVAIIGIIAMIALTWGGIIYFFSTGNPEKIKESKERMKSAGLGLIILLLSYLILITINPQLVILDIPGLTPIIFDQRPRKPLEIKQASLIMEELPIAQLTEKGLWEQEKTERIKNLNLELENFLKEKIEIRDSNLKNNEFKLISDLNKYLKTVTDECRNENLTAICTKPQHGSLPIGCQGDPCQTDQGDAIEPDSARDRINKAIEIDREKIRIILEYQEKFNKEKDLMRQELRKYQEVQAEMISCQTNNKELILLNNYLSIKQTFEKEENRVAVIKSYIESKGNPLTFYCTSGGTIFDYPYDFNNPEEEEEKEAVLEDEETFKETTFGETKISCSFEIPTGETLDKLRELGVEMVFKLERMSLLLTDLAEQIQEMTGLVSQCNSSQAEVSCNCIPNPCYQCCSPIPCGPCVLFCRSRCLQGVGVCHGEACPVAEIQEKVEQIKKTEDKILGTSKIVGVVEEIKSIFPQVAYNLNDPKNPYNLNNLSTTVGLCYSSDVYNPTWSLLNCEQARGNYGTQNQIITNCHPRNLYCCTPFQQTLSLSLPIPTKTSPIYIIPTKEFQPLPVIENCPFAWLCSDPVKDYNQYQDASEPLKQLLSCMRARLDRIEQREELTQTIGLISAISDPNLYQGSCSWISGPEESNGCSYNYEIKRGKLRISAHYGGISCRYEKKSYAVDLDMSSDFQKAYVDEIIAATKECAPDAYILDKTTHVHIDIGEANNCGTVDF